MTNKKTKAFTLIEMTIVIVIVGIIGAIGGAVLYKSLQAGYTSQEQLERNWQTNLALTRISNELREARNFPPTAQANLPSNPTTSLQFTTINGNTITYARSGNLLQRTLDSGTAQNIAKDISSLSFTYFKADHTKTTVKAEVRCIIIAVTVAPSLAVQTLVCPRNL